MATGNSSVSRAPRPSSLADVLDLILDKGLVIDAYVRVSALGIELLTIDARVVVASVDTYLHFAEAVNRLDLRETETAGLQGLTGGLKESGARGEVRGALQGVSDAIHRGGDRNGSESGSSRGGR